MNILSKIIFLKSIGNAVPVIKKDTLFGIKKKLGWLWIADKGEHIAVCHTNGRDDHFKSFGERAICVYISKANASLINEGFHPTLNPAYDPYSTKPEFEETIIKINNMIDISYQWHISIVNTI